MNDRYNLSKWSTAGSDYREASTSVCEVKSKVKKFGSRPTYNSISDQLFPRKNF